jgi:tripartite-type tricarboxylate transporter receptor subunit TctC
MPALVSRAIALALLLALATPAPAAAQSYPSRPVTLVVPVGAGTLTDAVARVLADYLKSAFGQTFVVENRPGAAATLGSRFVSRAAPDGYTLLLGGNTTHSVVPSTFKVPPYDPVTDFTPVARIGKLGSFLATNARQPFKTIQDMVTYARANPGKLTYGHGNGSGQIIGETIKTRLGVDIIRLPYTSNPTALTDLMADNIQLMVPDMRTGVSLVESGKIVALAMSTKVRSRWLPDMPTFDETVLPGFELLSWNGLFGPPGLPRDVVERMADALRRMLTDEAFVTRLLTVGTEPYYMAPEPFAAFVAADVPIWTEHARVAGIEPQ